MSSKIIADHNITICEIPLPSVMRMKIRVTYSPLKQFIFHANTKNDTDKKGVKMSRIKVHARSIGLGSSE